MRQTRRFGIISWGLLKNQDTFERSIHNAHKLELETLAPMRERFQTVLSLLADCEREAANYVQNIGRAGEAMRRALEVQIMDVENRYAALIRERNELQTQLDTRKLTDQAIQAALSFREEVIAGMHDPAFGR